MVSENCITWIKENEEENISACYRDEQEDLRLGEESSKGDILLVHLEP